MSRSQGLFREDKFLLYEINPGTIPAGKNGTLLSDFSTIWQGEGWALPLRWDHRFCSHFAFFSRPILFLLPCFDTSPLFARLPSI